ERTSLLLTFSRGVPAHPSLADSWSATVTTSASFGMLGKPAFFAALQNSSKDNAEFFAAVMFAASTATTTLITPGLSVDCTPESFESLIRITPSFLNVKSTSPSYNGP